MPATGLCKTVDAAKISVFIMACKFFFFLFFAGEYSEVFGGREGERREFRGWKILVWERKMRNFVGEMG